MPVPIQPIRCMKEAEGELAGVAVDQAHFRLHDLDPLLRIVQPVAGDARAELREQRRNALLQPDEGKAGQDRQPDPDLDRHREARVRRPRQQDAKPECGERDLREEFRGDVNDGRGGGGVPFDPVQRNRAGAEDEAADLREWQAVGWTHRAPSAPRSAPMADA